jgi:CrcB protein
MPGWLLIGIGGFLGAISRFGLAGWAQRQFGGGEVLAGGFPAGTLAVNLAGCLAAGVALGWLRVEQSRIESEWPVLAAQFLVVGFLGSLTTFSAFGMDTLDLLQADRISEATFSIGANLVGGLGMVALGWYGIRAVVA